MKWYALYIDGELAYMKKNYGTPSVRDFSIGELPNTNYKIVRLATSGVGTVLGSIPIYRK